MVSLCKVQVEINGRIKVYEDGRSHDFLRGHRADLRIILETDAAAIAARVSRPKADTTDIVINEQTLLNACEYEGLTCACS